MLDNKKVEDNTLLSIRKNIKEDIKSTKHKRLILLLSVLLSLAIIAFVYFSMSISNIYRVVVVNNYYLDDSEIINVSGIKDDDKFVLTVPFIIENRIKEHALIKDCKVRLLKNRIVEIAVSEKKIIGYAYEDNNNVIILEDDSRLTIDKEQIHLISKVPLIDGFSKEEIVLIEKNLIDCDSKIINEVSEIHKYNDLKFQNVEIIMRDGNYIFTSVYGLNFINQYYDVASSYQTGRHNCYYFEDISGRPILGACPWEELIKENKEETKEEE